MAESVSKGKVFGIGFHKTGTTSLKKVLKELGYDVCGEIQSYSVIHHVFEDDFPSLKKLSDKHSGFQDSPWNHPGFYQQLDSWYPDSKFILTVREMNSWFESLAATLRHMNYLQDIESDLKKVISPDLMSPFELEKKFFIYEKGYTAKDFWRLTYGVCPSNEEELLRNKPIILSSHEQHIKNATSYFEKKYPHNYKEKLLIVRWQDKDTDQVTQIANFVGQPRPLITVPWKNKTADKI